MKMDLDERIDLDNWKPPTTRVEPESPEAASRRARFWSTLGKKIAHGPAVRIPDGYDSRAW